MRFSRWQTVAILGVTVFLCVAAVPNVLPASILDRLPSWAQRQIALGYDLRGGGHYQLAIDAAYVRREQLGQLLDQARQLMRERRVAYTGLTIRNGGVEFSVRNTDDMPRALSALDTFRELPRSIHPREAPFVFDGRPNWTEARNAQALEADVTVDVADRFVRLEPTDTAIRRRIVQARRQSAAIVEARMNEVGGPTRLRYIGEDRIAIDIPFSIERIRGFIP